MKRKDMINSFNLLYYEIDRIYTDYAKSKDLTQTSLFVLRYLAESKENPTQKEIADFLGIHLQMVNLSIKYFLEKEYIELKENKNDRRFKNIFLTESGKEFSSYILDPLYYAESHIWDDFDDMDIKRIIDIMKAYTFKFKNLI